MKLLAFCTLFFISIITASNADAFDLAALKANIEKTAQAATDATLRATLKSACPDAVIDYDKLTTNFKDGVMLLDNVRATTKNGDKFSAGSIQISNVDVMKTLSGEKPGSADVVVTNISFDTYHKSKSGKEQKTVGSIASVNLTNAGFKQEAKQEQSTNIADNQTQTSTETAKPSKPTLYASIVSSKGLNIQKETTQADGNKNIESYVADDIEILDITTPNDDKLSETEFLKASTSKSIIIDGKSYSSIFDAFNAVKKIN